MTSETTNPTSSTGPGETPPRRYTVSRGLLNAGVLIAVFAVGAIGGTMVDHRWQRYHPHAVLLLQPAPIAKLADSNPVAIKGQVTEIFGNKFIIQDDSGHTLVDTGPRGEGGKPIATGETITVQGHFDHGFIHADVMTRADGTNEEFGPGRHPHPGHGPGMQPPPPRS
jgi:hypothetical protein